MIFKSLGLGSLTCDRCFCCETHIVSELQATSSASILISSSLSNSSVGSALLFILFNFGFQSETKRVFVIISSLSSLTVVTTVIDNTLWHQPSGSVYTWYLSHTDSTHTVPPPTRSESSWRPEEEKEDEQRGGAFSSHPSCHHYGGTRDTRACTCSEALPSAALIL